MSRKEHCSDSVLYCGCFDNSKGLSLSAIKVYLAVISACHVGLMEWRQVLAMHFLDWRPVQGVSDSRPMTAGIGSSHPATDGLCGYRKWMGGWTIKCIVWVHVKEDLSPFCHHCSLCLENWCPSRLMLKGALEQLYDVIFYLLCQGILFKKWAYCYIDVSTALGYVEDVFWILFEHFESISVKWNNLKNISLHITFCQSNSRKIPNLIRRTFFLDAFF